MEGTCYLVFLDSIICTLYFRYGCQWTPSTAQTAVPSTTDSFGWAVAPLSSRISCGMAPLGTGGVEVMCLIYCNPLSWGDWKQWGLLLDGHTYTFLVSTTCVCTYMNFIPGWIVTEDIPLFWLSYVAWFCNFLILSKFVKSTPLPPPLHAHLFIHNTCTCVLLL